MVDRHLLMEELGLAPEWQLRRAPDAAVGETAVADAEMRDGNTGRTARLRESPGTVVATPRAAHIAALPWSAFAADVDGCTACGLCRTRNKSVPGVGDTAADWLFVGEAPGAEEDARGEPFVGQAGKLLDNMLAALGLARGRNVYIANVLKCRPPGNRTPEDSEADACRPYLERQIALVAPRLIVALGKSAASLLLGTDASIASLRGRVHRYQGVPLVVTYHPAYLLRTPADKAKAWEDLLLAQQTVAESMVAAP